jgi:hypothetical protein
MTFGITMMKRDTQLNSTQTYAEFHFMLCVENEPFMLSVVMLNVIMLSVVVPVFVQARFSLF